MKRVTSRDIGSVLGGRRYVDRIAREYAEAERTMLGNYHPGNLTADEAFKHSEPPPMSERIVETRRQPVLYDAEARPIYRKAGFTP